MSPQTTPGKKAASAVALPYWIEEFSQLRLAVAALLAAALFGTLAVTSSAGYGAAAIAGEQLARQTRQQAYEHFSQAEQEKQDIRTYQPRFLALHNKGLVGAERRLNWLDGLRQIQERRKLLPLSYEIAPQRTVRTDGQPELGDYQLYASQMRLHLDLLHEMDLLNLFEDLKQYGFAAVQDCSIKRQAVAQNSATAATLVADCTLNWVTLSMPPAAIQKATP